MVEGTACIVAGRGHAVERKKFCLYQVYGWEERVLLYEESIQLREGILFVPSLWLGVEEFIVAGRGNSVERKHFCLYQVYGWRKGRKRPCS